MKNPIRALARFVRRTPAETGQPQPLPRPFAHVLWASHDTASLPLVRAVSASVDVVPDLHEALLRTLEYDYDVVVVDETRQARRIDLHHFEDTVTNWVAGESFVREMRRRSAEAPVVILGETRWCETDYGREKRRLLSLRCDAVYADGWNIAQRVEDAAR